MVVRNCHPSRSEDENSRLDARAVRLRFTRRRQELGFTLKEIKKLLELQVKGRTTCEEMRSFTEAKVKDIENRIRSLRRMSQALTKLASQYETQCNSRACTLLDHLGTDF